MRTTLNELPDTRSRELQNESNLEIALNLYVDHNVNFADMSAYRLHVCEGARAVSNVWWKSVPHGCCVVVGIELLPTGFDHKHG